MQKISIQVEKFGTENILLQVEGSGQKLVTLVIDAEGRIDEISSKQP